MRKEPIIAIVLGSLVGVGVAFAIWKTTKVTKVQSDKVNQTETQELGKQENSQKGLTLVTPDLLSIQTKTPVQIQGVAIPNSFIAIISEEEQVLSLTNASGKFSTEVELTGGINNLQIIAFEEGRQESTPLTLIYSTQIEVPIGLMATIGTITDITDNTLQIRTKEDQIEQISTSEQTTYTKTTDETSTELEFKDLAIGDFIAAIGAKNSNGITEATRILITSETEAPSIKTIYGTIKTLSSSEFIVSDFSGEEFSVDAKGKVNVTKLEDDEFVRGRLAETGEGDKIIILGKMDEELVAERIHIFPKI